jgi:hypothetical protein
MSMMAEYVVSSLIALLRNAIYHDKIRNRVAIALEGYPASLTNRIMKIPLSPFETDINCSGGVTFPLTIPGNKPQSGNSTEYSLHYSLPPFTFSRMAITSTSLGLYW